MAKSDDLFKTLRKRGLRKSAARAVADAEGGGKKSAAVAREVLADLDEASDTIRDRVTNRDARKRGARKAATTRKRQAAKRSDAAKRAATTRKARARSR
jgi:hypothetical protein